MLKELLRGLLINEYFTHGMKFGKVHVVILSMIMAFMLLVILEYPFLLFKYHSWKDAGVNNIEELSLSTTVDVVPFSIQGVPNSRFFQHGFTCTGLAYDESEDCFWAGNVGMEYPGDDQKNPSLIKLSRDFEIIDEIDAFVLTSSRKNTNLQGVAYDTSDNVLWVSFGGGYCV